MSVIKAKNLQKSYGSLTVLADVSFSLERGQKVALVGHNGTGKTTLLKIVAGLEEPDAGNLEIARNVCVGYLPQDTGLAGEETIAAYLRQTVGIDVLEERMEVLSSELADSGKASQYDQVREQYEKLNGYSFAHRIEIMLSGFGLDTGVLDALVSDIQSAPTTFDKQRIVLSALTQGILDLDSLEGGAKLEALAVLSALSGSLGFGGLLDIDSASFNAAISDISLTNVDDIANLALIKGNMPNLDLVLTPPQIAEIGDVLAAIDLGETPSVTSVEGGAIGVLQIVQAIRTLGVGHLEGTPELDALGAQVTTMLAALMSTLQGLDVGVSTATSPVVSIEAVASIIRIANLAGLDLNAGSVQISDVVDALSTVIGGLTETLPSNTFDGLGGSVQMITALMNAVQVLRASRTPASDYHSMTF